VYAQNTTFIGLDVHKKSIVGAMLLPGAEKREELGKIVNEPGAVKRLVKKLKKRAPGPIVSCYEAGPCGYDLQRQLTSLGLLCMVVAPSLIPRKPGERIKTDRRDAKKLAEYLRAGLLTEVHPPTPAEEAVRDLTRAREDAKQDQMRARHRLVKFLLRQGHVYRRGRHWTARHHEWLRRRTFEEPSATVVFNHYMLTLEQVTERLEELERQLTEVAESPPYAEKVGWLRCFRGIDTVVAMTLLAELHDFRRFTNPRELMSYLGLTPSEHSSDEKKRRGGITKTGNSHVRRMLVQAAWSYRHRPAVSAYMTKRRQGQPAAVIAIADRAQQRLHRRYQRLKARQKHHNVINIAVARELVGFIWSTLQPTTEVEVTKDVSPPLSSGLRTKRYRLRKA
jgi:transposase